jgi:hypothetical protein
MGLLTPRTWAGELEHEPPRDSRGKTHIGAFSLLLMPILYPHRFSLFFPLAAPAENR